MNTIKMNNWAIVTALFGALSFSTLAFAAQPVEVRLTVTAAPALEVVNNNSSCNGAATDPCIVVGKGTTPFIKFILPHACDGSENDPKYELTGMRITMIEKDWPTPTNPLNSLVAKDFKADPSTGEIKFHAGNNKKTSRLLKLKDSNSRGYTVFYEISASPCDESSDDPEITLDPEIRNKGNN